jgi:hypothetical protein
MNGDVLPTKDKVWLCRCGGVDEKAVPRRHTLKDRFQSAAQAVPSSAEKS